jgi:exo-beta-1,3-glucanase (GH17 family)
MMRNISFLLIFMGALLFTGCGESNTEKDIWAEDILGNPAYHAISFGGYRHETREQVPSVEELKEDMKILYAMGIRILRTYNTQQFGETPRLLQAISELKADDPAFEMYVMLGVWIDCEGAFTDNPDHTKEDLENNTAEINAAVHFANKYPDIIKVIAVGNEAMVHWAASYFVEPTVILKWVNHLQELKSKGEIDDRIWITSSDNFASWGGGDDSYHKPGLEKLIAAVDYVSLHTYPFHDTHYNADFWRLSMEEEDNTIEIQVDSAMSRAFRHAQNQYDNVAKYIQDLGIEKPIHIGETGWSTTCNTLFSPEGSRAADEYKQKLYYDAMRKWTDEEGISCFFFEAFDEPWKDDSHPDGSENHFWIVHC